MKFFGMFGIFTGAVWAITAFNMETTRGSVHNIGLLAEKQNHLIVSLVVLCIGILLVVLSKKPQGVTDDSPVLKQGSTKTCPFCAETIKKEAKLCRFCKRELVQTSSEFKEFFTQAKTQLGLPDEKFDGQATPNVETEASKAQVSKTENHQFHV